MLKDFLAWLFNRESYTEDMEPYEYCPRCDANLTLQKGYSNEAPYWVCKGCGEMLINPAVEAEDDVSWICDWCGEMLNIQSGFSTDCGEWECTECGHVNKIDASEIYSTEDEYEASLHDPYKGLTDADIIALTEYEEIGNLESRPNVLLVKNLEDGRKYVKKYVKDYDISIYRYLLEHPIAHMPKLFGLYEGTNNLVVIEEYIEGSTLSEIMYSTAGAFNQGTAINITIDVLRILSDLHSLENPIVHRDVKPSNIILAKTGELYLLDINIAKWYKEDEKEDTKLFATQYYAAPEQFGYGFKASSEKTDIYAVGIMLNEMITGCLPRDERATGPVWDIIEKCISLEPENRYTAKELIEELKKLQTQV